MTSLTKCKLGETFQVLKVEGKPKTQKFLFSLGCSEGASVTVISKIASSYVIHLRDSRYAIDDKMAKTIWVK